MFENGLHNRVDIHFLNRDYSNRIKKDNIKISGEPDLKNIPCRILKDEKVIFAGVMMLEDGYTITDIDSKTVYEIRQGKRIRGIHSTHHSSYEIRFKGESGR